MGAASWLVAWPPRLSPLIDLICCPGAGAGASTFRGWPGALPGFARVLAVQAPGRETRLDEPPAESLNAIADGAAASYLDGPARPVALFGHSMGGALAVEMARRLSDAGRAPHAVILSASSPPRGAGGAALSAEALRALLLDYDPQNAALVAQDDLYSALAPTLSADIALLRGHRMGAEPRLSARAILLAGAEDRVVPAEAVAGWSAYFETPAAPTTLPGGHHFPFQDAAEAVTALIAKILKEALKG